MPLAAAAVLPALGSVFETGREAAFSAPGGSLLPGSLDRPARQVLAWTGTTCLRQRVAHQDRRPGEQPETVFPGVPLPLWHVSATAFHPNRPGADRRIRGRCAV